MTNGELLESVLNKNGITKIQFAKALGITRQGLYRKIRNLSEFKQSEIEKASRILNLDSESEKAIFFCLKV